MTWTAEQRAQLEATLRRTSWKQLVTDLKTAVERHHVPLELPPMIRRWLEVNRGEPESYAEAEHRAREIVALKAWSAAPQEHGRWFEDQTEVAPISGWVIAAAHVLRDGKRWWIFAARRHDDAAPLIGQTVPAPALPRDLRKLRRIVDFAGGDARRELLCTGAITRAEHDDLVAAGKPEFAEYGQIFYWWRA